MHGSSVEAEHGAHTQPAGVTGGTVGERAAPNPGPERYFCHLPYLSL